MGMHFGVIAADMSWPELLDLFKQSTGDFVDQGPVASSDDLNLDPVDEGFPLAAGELDGRSYVLDTSMILSMGAPDFLLKIAETSGKLIVGCGAETVSGTYSLFVARGSEVLRHFYHCHSSISQPFSAGAPFPTEAQSALEDLDGSGLFAVLRHLGFDFEAWYERGERRRILYTANELEEGFEGLSLLHSGPLGHQLDEHIHKFELSPEEVPPLTAVVRDSATGQVISEASTGTTLYGKPADKKNWLQRLLERLFK